MKVSSIFILLLFFIACNCSTCVEPNLTLYEIYLENTSSYDLVVSLSDRGVEFEDSITVFSGETKKICDFSHENYIVYACPYGVIRFAFENNLGYICEQSFGAMNVSPICFLNGKNPFIPNRLPNNGNGGIFTITQEDFDNAYELP